MEGVNKKILLVTLLGLSFQFFLKSTLTLEGTEKAVLDLYSCSISLESWGDQAANILLFIYFILFYSNRKYNTVKNRRNELKNKFA